MAMRTGEPVSVVYTGYASYRAVLARESEAEPCLVRRLVAPTGEVEENEEYAPHVITGGDASAELAAERRERRALERVRPCLRCGTDFRSAHAGNRLCGGCRQYASDHTWYVMG